MSQLIAANIQLPVKPGRAQRSRDRCHGYLRASSNHDLWLVLSLFSLRVLTAARCFKFRFLSGIQMPTAESKKSSSGSLSTRRSPPWLAGWIVCSSAAWSESLEVPSLRFAGNLSGIFKMSTVWKAARFAVCDSSEHVGWMFWVLFQVPLRLQPLSHRCFCSCSLLESSVCSVLSVSPIFWE